MRRPFRLRYAAPIVREQAQFMGRSGQFTQLGAELIGDAGASADMRSYLAAEALDAAGVSKWRIACGSVRPMKELLDACGLKEDDRAAVLGCIHGSDFVDLDELVQTLEVSEDARRALCGLARVCGGAEAIEQVRELLAPCGVDTSCVDELEKLFAAARALRFGDRLVIDFSIMNSFDYYTGLVFSIYADGVFSPLGSGGRYDDAFSRWGRKTCPRGLLPSSSD
ncbi:MAG: ATP phosphoribosyltransferase regulatory subunit [Eggerthellaceae bacterium]